MGLDVESVAEVLRPNFEVVMVQEIQRGQFMRLQRALGAQFGRWTFKHWPVRNAAEGLGVLSMHQVDVRSITISRGFAPWQWQRRVAQVVSVLGRECVNTHLGTGADGTERARQIERIMRCAPRAELLAGDLNEWDGPALCSLRSNGFVDAWAECNRHAEFGGATNWSTNDRTIEPDQQLDWVWTRGGLRAVAANLGDWRTTNALSDHVPLFVEIGGFA